MALLSKLADNHASRLAIMIAGGVLVIYLGYELMKPSPLMLKHEGNAHFKVLETFAQNLARVPA